MLQPLEPLFGMPQRRTAVPYSEPEQSPAGGNAAPEGDNTVDIMTNYWRSVGYPDHVIAGMLGSGQSESGLDSSINELNPVVEGSRGGFSTFQWTGPRRVQFEAFLDQNNVDRANKNQMDLAAAQFTHHENMTTEQAAWEEVMRTTTADEAADVFTDEWLRPGINHSGKSQKNALSFADRIGAEASDIQLDLRNEKEQIALGTYTSAMMFASPDEKAEFMKSLKYEPQGRPTTQGTPHQSYRTAATDPSAAYGPLLAPAPNTPQGAPYSSDGPGAAPLAYTPQEAPTPNPHPDVFNPPGGETPTRVSSRSGSTGGTSGAGADATSAIEADERTVPDPSWKNRLEALGVGLAQISAGGPVNVGGVWDRNINRFQADTQAVNAKTGRMAAETGQKSEARLQQAMDYELEQAAKNESARVLFAQDHYNRTGNKAEAIAIAQDPGAFKTAFDSRFGAGKSGSVTDYTRQVAEYAGDSEEAVAGRERAAQVAREAKMGEAMVEAVLNDKSGNTALKAVENAARQTAEQKNLSGLPDYQEAAATVERMIATANQAGNTAKAAYLQEQLEQLELGGRDAKSISEVFDNIREYSQKGGLQTQERELEEGFNRRTADILTAQGHEDLAEIALTDPKGAVEMAEERKKLANAEAADMREQASKEQVALNFEELANDPEIDDDTREQYLQIAAMARAGDVREAASIYRQMKNKPSEQRLLEWFRDSPEYLEIATDLRKAESGTTRSGNVDKIWYERLQRGSELQDQLVQQEDALLSAMQMANDPQFQSGPLVGMMTGIDNAFQDIFGTTAGLNDNSTNSQVFQAMSSGIIFLQKQPGSGHISDWDGQKFQEGIFSLDKSEDANRAVIQAMYRTNQLKQAGHDALMQYYSEGGDMNDKAARTAYVKKYQDDLGIQSEAFYDLDRASGSNKGEKIDDPIANARMLTEQGKLKDGDYIFINGQMTRWDSSVLEE